MARPSSVKGSTPKPSEKLAETPPISNTTVTNSTPTPSKKAKSASYKSDGVDDNDVFLLPISDYQIMFGMTILSAIVRLFKIYQPTSVVFDEVQCVSDPPPPPSSLGQATANCVKQLRWVRFQVH
jgi:dolichyl-phosphate-mannose-protein mannosyltransferase